MSSKALRAVVFDTFHVELPSNLSLSLFVCLFVCLSIYLNDDISLCLSCQLSLFLFLNIIFFWCCEKVSSSVV